MSNTVTKIRGTDYTDFALQAFDRDDLKKLALLAHTERNSSVDRSWLGSKARHAQLVAFCLGNPIENIPAWASGTVADAAPVDASARLAAMPQAEGYVLPEGDPYRWIAGPQGTNAESQLIQSILALAGKVKGESVDSAKVEQICNDLLDVERGKIESALAAHSEEMKAIAAKVNAQPVAIEITVNGERIAHTEGLRHEGYDDLLADVSAFIATGKTDKANFWLTGEAGTGKTTAAEHIAKSLDLDFRFNGAIDSEYKLRGFIDAQGRVIYTPFRHAYENGGIYLFDEVDSSLPSACLAFNAALSNGCYDFPGVDKPIKRHPKCVIFAASNTWNGPSGGYVGRFKQDAAFIDRFMRIPWETDEKLEGALCNRADWHQFVVKSRAAIRKHGLEHIVSPRATFNGDIMLAAGRPWKRVVDCCVRKGLNDADWKKVTEGGN